MTVTMTNLTRRMQVFVLLHDHHCAALGRCTCDLRKDGRRLPTSLTLPVGERADVASAVLSVPAVARALRVGDLSLLSAQPPSLSTSLQESSDER
jgi:hypothetical protein